MLLVQMTFNFFLLLSVKNQKMVDKKPIVEPEIYTHNASAGAQELGFCLMLNV